MLKTLLIAASLILIPAAASAAPQCGPREAAMTQLEENYDEIPVGMGVTNTGGLVELLQSRDEETWTITVTTPDGMTCLVAAGEGWRSSPVTPESNKLEF